MKRWLEAQQYERNWWDKRKENIDFGFYRKYADELREFTEGFIKISSDISILEVGSGAGGILTYLKESNKKYAIDPLEDFYYSVEKFRSQRDPSVNYQKAKGESMPFENESMDLIIMDNVLDHCDEPEQVIHEIARVLKKDGLIYLKQNTYHFWGKAVRSVMEQFHIDKGHPHTFTKKILENLIISCGLKIIKQKKNGYLTTWMNEIRSMNVKRILQAMGFVTRDKVSYLIQIKN